MTNRRNAAWLLLLLLTCSLLAPLAHAGKLDLPPEATEGLQLLYRGDPDRAIEIFRRLQQKQPDHPLGYLLEANARWWKTYCAACEMKWGMVDAWKKPKRPEDDAYFALADRAIQLAEVRLAKTASAEMHLYAGSAWALKGRLLSLRDEKRATARAGVKMREHLLRALELDPNLTDAYTGLGLYNYYVDTLSGIAKVLRFFMGLPGGSKKEGMRQLELAIKNADLTAVEARFYLAKCLRNYDQQYERAAELMQSLVEQYPSNPLFHLLLGNMNAKLNRNAKAAASFRAAQNLELRDSACATRAQQLARTALESLRSTPANTGP